jgi:hypothetical protein
VLNKNHKTKNTVMKKVGIVVDDHKIVKFKKELEAIAIDNIETNKFSKNCTLIMLNVFESQIVEIHRICCKLEIDFKHSN